MSFVYHWLVPARSLKIQKSHFRNSISSWADWKTNHWSDRETKSMMKVFVKGTFNLPSCGFQQTNWETGAPEVPAGWKAEEGKTLVTQLLRVVGLSPTAPTKEEGLCLLSISETGNWERVPGSGPGKRPGRAPCSTCHRTILISSLRPCSPSLGPQGEWGSRKECGQEVVGSVRARGTACFQAPWDLSGITPVVANAHIPASERLYKRCPKMSSSSFFCEGNCYSEGRAHCLDWGPPITSDFLRI